MLTVYVDYPPRECDVLDDLSVIQGERVLVLEDDVISGVTIQMVVAELLQHEPASLSLLLGRAKEDLTTMKDAQIVSVVSWSAAKPPI